MKRCFSIKSFWEKIEKGKKFLNLNDADKIATFLFADGEGGGSLVDTNTAIVVQYWRSWSVVIVFSLPILMSSSAGDACLHCADCSFPLSV